MLNSNKMSDSGMALNGSVISVIGNCQTDSIAKYISILNPHHKVHHFSYVEALDQKKRKENEKLLEESDYVIAQPLRSDSFGKFSYDALKDREGSIFINAFSFAGFQPDCVYLGQKKAINRSSPVGDYNSSIAVYAYLNGASVQETLQLYNEKTYRKLGFFDVWEANKTSLIARNKALGIDLTDLFDTWIKGGLFMHTVNHPYAHVLSDIARLILDKANIEHKDFNPTKFLTDNGANDIVWPVYPEIGEALGLEGEMVFKASDRWTPANERPKLFDLEEFVQKSFDIYNTIPREKIVCRSIAMSHDESVEIIGNIVSDYRRANASTNKRQVSSRTKNPYAGLPAHQFWRKSISRVSIADVDPVVSMPFTISTTDRVATAGSCFAQHIASRLQQQDFNYFVTETAPEGMSEEQARKRNYGVFSARYGNLYTTRQLLQLFDRVYGNFTPIDSVWDGAKGGFVDPFRPQIEPDGFASPDDVLKAREEHFSAVRKIFEECEIFVFTLGLTEAWRSSRDGAVFPLAPGVAGGHPGDDYEFVNFSADEVTADLKQFIEKLRTVNPTCRVLLTVSPVPLIATYEPRHVLVSTTYSKSVLRVAAEEACNSFDRVHYFPSYEIIVGNYNKGIYYDDDMRSIRKEGVDHVMRLFFKHLTDAEQTSQSVPQPEKTEPLAEKPSTSMEDRISALDAVVCDEEAIDS
nr:GSCFA domain-containing protein [uncultured Cohaesibacter sp.]